MKSIRQRMLDYTKQTGREVFVSRLNGVTLIEAQGDERSVHLSRTEMEIAKRGDEMLHTHPHPDLPFSAGDVLSFNSYTNFKIAEVYCYDVGYRLVRHDRKTPLLSDLLIESELGTLRTMMDHPHARENRIRALHNICKALGWTFEIIHYEWSGIVPERGGEKHEAMARDYNAL